MVQDRIDWHFYHIGFALCESTFCLGLHISLLSSCNKIRYQIVPEVVISLHFVIESNTCQHHE